jgi:hypothetical protein
LPIAGFVASRLKTRSRITRRFNGLAMSGSAIATSSAVCSSVLWARASGLAWSAASNHRACRQIERARARLEALVKANAAPRCGAVQAYGEALSRGSHAEWPVRVHGGMSTGPRTPEGLERSRKANWKHGRRSRAASEERERVRSAIRMLRYLATMVKRDLAD